MNLLLYLSTRYHPMCTVCSLKTYCFLSSYSSLWYPRHVLISLTTYTKVTVWSAVFLTCFLVGITAARHQPSLIFFQLSKYTFPSAFASVLFGINMKFLFMCAATERLFLKVYLHRVMLLHFITYLIFVSESAIIWLWNLSRWLL